MHGDPGRGPAVNIVHNNNNNLYPPQNLAGLRNNMLPPPPRNMHAGNPPVGTVYIPREDDNMSQLSMIRNFQLHTRHNQNSYFGEGNEDDQYPPGLLKASCMVTTILCLSPPVPMVGMVVMSICTKIEFVQ